MPPLFSGNGRHRRPRQAPNFVVAAGVTGAGIAIPLLGATSASAASAETWDKVAECESGAVWSANSANEENGYYGGLQLDQATWDSYGGQDYAERPDLASRDQQITVAQRVLDEEGAERFGYCGEEAGLADDDEDPDVDPDGLEGGQDDDPVAERPYPTDPSQYPDGEDNTEDGTEDGAEDDGQDDSQDGNWGDGWDGWDGGQDGMPDEDAPADDASDAPDPSDSEDPSEPTERPAPPESADPPESPAPDPSEGSDEGDSGDWQEPTAPVFGGSEPETPDEESGSGSDEDTVRVGDGDSLYSIAEEENVEGGWRQLYEKNRDHIGSDPDVIAPGLELRL